MAGLFDTGGPSTLEDVLGKQAANKVAGIDDQYTQARKKKVSMLAANGQLMGGTADYPLADLDKAGADAEAGVYGDLASALGGVTSEDWLNQNKFNRDSKLARYIGSLNKPSSLQEALGALGVAGNLAGTAAMFA